MMVIKCSDIRDSWDLSSVPRSDTFFGGFFLEEGSLSDATDLGVTRGRTSSSQLILESESKSESKSGD